MAWEFSTEPEFEEQLVWMRDFVRAEIWPIEAIEHDIDQVLALSDGITSDALLRAIIDRVPVPVVPLREHDRLNVSA